MSKLDDRAMDRAIDRLKVADVMGALRILCQRRRREVPEIEPAAPRTAAPAPKLTPAVVTGGPQPKPEKRKKDHRLLQLYSDTHPQCEILGCTNEPCPEPHHLIPNGAKTRESSEHPNNLARLCLVHHNAYHTLGPRQWLAVLGAAVPALLRQKVQAAARIEEEAA